jgi:hypothetical protein
MITLKRWQQRIVDGLAKLDGPPWVFDPLCTTHPAPPIRRVKEGTCQCPLSALGDAPWNDVRAMDLVAGNARRRLVVIYAADGHLSNPLFDPAFRKAMVEACKLVEPLAIPDRPRGSPPGGPLHPDLLDDLGVDQGGGPEGGA